MKKFSLIILVGTIALIMGTSNIVIASYWADSIYGFNGGADNSFCGGIDLDGDGVADSGETFYPSGVNPNVALGEPDASFVSILYDEYITVEFTTSFVNRPGYDFYVVETGPENEKVNVAVSSDGTTFSSLGIITCTGSQNTLFGKYYGLELGSINEPISYIKISGVSGGGKAPGFDLSGVCAVNPVPIPSTVLLLITGLIGIIGSDWKKFFINKVS